MNTYLVRHDGKVETIKEILKYSVSEYNCKLINCAIIRMPKCHINDVLEIDGVYSIEPNYTGSFNVQEVL